MSDSRRSQIDLIGLNQIVSEVRQQIIQLVQGVAELKGNMALAADWGGRAINQASTLEIRIDRHQEETRAAFNEVRQLITAMQKTEAEKIERLQRWAILMLASTLLSVLGFVMTTFVVPALKH